MNQDTFEHDPRDYAIELVESGAVNAQTLLECALKYLSHDDVRKMLDWNKLSPRFMPEHQD
jgi:hypothetical protein